MHVTLKYAAEHFPDLASAACRGEEVEIAVPGEAALKLVVSGREALSAEREGRRILGAGRGRVRVPAWEEWKAMDAEQERAMGDAPLISSGEV